MKLNKIVERLSSLGYTYDESDESAITFTIEKVTNEILNRINCSELPKELEEKAIDMVCANFLKLKKDLGLLKDLKFEDVVESMSMGDTKVQFATDSTPEQQYDAILNYMSVLSDDDVYRYRKLVW